ncbi:MBOAT family O-acyltransferase [Denitrificimonas sp. JX-1]|uniref:Probable alginate O-acetylase n=1 Tax=Denitrificimonas halotolerans TaxID=3098930 RepID=A0ABU5GSL0_9GAMM|nr:MBOAT family O-acyltransferase [Denitrificimonas sp. JX-1]MDY7219497.1 MBOAT family O-acyltransferase [Denitrificimonas sp. JX-1]
MNLLSFEFIIFFVTFLFIYWLPFLPSLARNQLLIAASYTLIALFSLQFALILLGYSLFIYALANYGDRLLTKKQIYLLLASVIFSLFIIFKYYAFFQESIQIAFSKIGWQIDLPLLNLLLPIGLSYYSFHSVSYVVSVQRQELPKARLTEVILYLCFFPSIIAGPINRATLFIPQIQNSQRALLEPKRALFLITLALLKLFLFSAWLAENMVDPVFNDPSGYSSEQNLIAMYAYAWNIYFNFSGYTDLVTGIALFLGFRLPINFNAPYLASNLKEFWTRWHISLSSFIRDYIYIPLGGGRKGWIRTQVNVLLAMTISGLWHGAATTFIIWGALHGLGVIFLNIMDLVLPKAKHRFGFTAFIRRNLARFICFHFVCFAWIFFRSNSFDNALLMLQQISTLHFPTAAAHYATPLLATALLYFFYPLLVSFTHHIETHSGQFKWFSYPIMLTIILSLAFSLAPDGMPNFIYANF